MTNENVKSGQTEIPKISIIIPVYNTGQYLEQCLDSIVEQTLFDIEIIAVNDGSTDNSLEILQKYAKQDSRIKILDLPNQDVSGARNSGIEVTSGKFILFVDSDDWIELNTCEKAYNAAIDNNADSVIFSYISEYSRYSKKINVFNGADIVFSGTEIRDEIQIKLIGLTGLQLKNIEKLDSLVSVWGKLYSADIIKNKGTKYVDLGLVPSECQLFNIEYYGFSKNTVYIDEYLYHYRRNNFTSFTNNLKSAENLLKKWLYWIDYEKVYINKNLNLDKAYEAYYNRICFSVIPLGKICMYTGFFSALKYLHSVLNNSIYKEAYKKLDFRYFQFHWKVYFYLAKKRFVFLFYMMNLILRFILNRRKR